MKQISVRGLAKFGLPPNQMVEKSKTFWALKPFGANLRWTVVVVVVVVVVVGVVVVVSVIVSVLFFSENKIPLCIPLHVLIIMHLTYSIPL